ncbi:hypothetical protein HaLaN_12486 [Haematococcus lacustris]|uniref:Secreted protein n=1 Tax=Haematococcus lacustris TaxID=44745 RepID=A0A699Z0R9_HAELA|nr:hypothetical protein HaLaN_12486 [Haematococcus lacustris]
MQQNTVLRMWPTGWVFVAWASSASASGLAGGFDACIATLKLHYQRLIFPIQHIMPPKPTGSAKKTGTKHSRSLSDSDTGSTPAFKSRELPKSRRLVAPATCTSPGASGSVATVLSTDREVVDEWSAPEVPITTHDVTDSVVTVMIAHYVMLLAGRKTDGIAIPSNLYRRAFTLCTDARCNAYIINARPTGVLMRFANV